MAAKRIASSTFNWTALAERVPEHQKAQFLAFKSKSDNYLRRMTANPVAPPAIDWEYYGNTVPVPGLVEEFRKQYKAVSIPIPNADAHFSQLDNMQKTLAQNIANFKAESQNQIKIHEEEINKIKASIPLDLMTYEEVYQYVPHYAEDLRNSFYPSSLEMDTTPDHH